MKRHPVVERLWDEVDQTLTALGFELVQMTFGGPPQSQSLTIYADKPGGSISSDDCGMLAEHVSVLLDTLDPIAQSYDLIVSSPGVNRPLGRDEDFPGMTGRRLLVRYVSESGKVKRLRGELLGVEEDRIKLDTGGGLQAVPLESITAANLQYEWESEGDAG
jgi:ribosome maturation factor RimP